MKNKFIRQWEHTHSPLLWIETIFVGDTEKMKQNIGFSFGSHYFINDKQTVVFYKNLNTARAAGKFGATRYNNQKFIRRFYRKSIQSEKELLRLSRYITTSNLRKKTNKEIVKIFENFFDLFSSLNGFYRAIRPEFYQITIDNLRKKYKYLSEAEFSNLLNDKFNGLKIIYKDKRIILGLKLLGERRFSMHKSWERAWRDAEYLFKEIGRRLGFSALEVQNCTRKEIVKSLIDQLRIDKRKIKKIIESYKLVYNKKNYHLIVPVPREKNKEQVQELRGTVAYGGFVSGRVTVIIESLKGTSKRVMWNMPKGNILVTVMTAPDMIPAMKKAGAIVTDEGGLLCHAAIVAREFKKPCVINTRIATRVLKDGDLVEVDANKGVVKIIK